MSRRALALVTATAIVAFAGCGSPAEPQPSTFSSTGAPPAVANRTPLPSCGVEQATRQDGPWDDTARACFWEAYSAQRPAEIASTRLTTEGDPLTTIYRVLGPGRVEVFINQTHDRYSAGGWLRLDCSTLARTDSTTPAPDFGPDDSCVETTL